MGGSMYFQHDPLEIGTLFLFLSCITTISFLFGRKTAAMSISSLNYARGLVVALYITSWLFTFVVAMLAQANNNNSTSCQVSSFICIFLYAGSKIFMYLFMVERVHVVTAIGVTRWNSRMFKFNIALLAPFSVVIALALKFRVAEIDDLGYCKIGLKTQSSVPLIAYDTLINIWLTFLFVRSLMSSTSKLQLSTGSRLRSVTQRTLIGAIISLILSSANIASFVVFDGHETSALCLALCTLDVTLNAVTIHWVTSPRRSPKTSMKPGPNRDWPSKVDSATMDGDVSPLKSHLSISIESYVEEYHSTDGLSREYNH